MRLSRPMADSLRERPALPAGDLLARRCFRAMNTNVAITLADWRYGHLLDRAERVFHEVEARFSRFREDSEISRFNRRDEDVFHASAAFMRLLAIALEFHERTNGVFEPAILPALEAAGYDRSFEMVADDDSARVVHRANVATIGDARIDRAACCVRGPADLRLDFGGIGKGYAVDLAAGVLSPARHFMINAGGDILASGRGPEGDGWDVGIADPADESQNVEIVRLRDAAIATSSIAKRRWRRGGRWQSHIIDPHTGEPVDNGLVAATAIAESATEADVFAKTALLLGPGARSEPALFIDVDGRVIRSAAWEAAVANAA